MWLRKFASLFYIAYLNCEAGLRDIALVILGLFAGLMFLLVSLGVLFSESAVPIIYIVLFNEFLIAAMVNLGIWVFWAFQLAVSIIFYLSFLRVAYIYDNRSWCYVNTAKKTASTLKSKIVKAFNGVLDYLDKDNAEAEKKQQACDAEIEAMIQKIKN